MLQRTLLLPSADGCVQVASFPGFTFKVKPGNEASVQAH